MNAFQVTQNATQPDPIFYQSFLRTTEYVKVFVEEWWQHWRGRMACVAFRERAWHVLPITTQEYITNLIKEV